MKSVKEKTQTSRAVFFDDDGIITQISGRVEDGNESKYAWFEIADVLPFLDGKIKMSDYVVSRTKNPAIYEILKRQVQLRQRNVKSQLTKIGNDTDAEIILKITSDGSIMISASKEVVNEMNVSENQDVQIAGLSVHPFFVTFKDRPDFLLEILSVPFAGILTGDGVVIQTPFEQNEISIYTKKYFNSYSLETV
jgi:hypothetical protein